MSEEIQNKLRSIPWMYADLDPRATRPVLVSDAESLRWFLEGGSEHCETCASILASAKWTYTRETDNWWETADEKTRDDYIWRANNERYEHEHTDTYGETQRIDLVLDSRFRGPWFVMRGRSDQCYGGAEEGGWWYHSESYQSWTMCSTEEEARAICNALKAQHSGERLSGDDLSLLGLEESSVYPEGYIPKGWSSRGRPLYVVCAWPQLGSHTRTPRYE